MIRILNNPDSRLHILLILAFSLVLWSLNYQALIILNIFAIFELSFTQSKRSIKFAGFWACSKLLLDFISYYFMTEHKAINVIFFESGLLFLRLFAVFALAFILCKYNSPRKLALSIAYFLSPILGHRAWQIALTSSIMIHFLPKSQEIFTKLSLQVNLRLHNLSKLKRLAFLISTFIALLALDIDKESLAILSRSLDKPEAWIYKKRFEIQNIYQLFYPVALLLSLCIISKINFSL